MKIRIYYEDTDAGGIVYHTNYLKYCERARSELFFQKGIMPFEEDGSGFVVRHIEAGFLGTATLGDIIEVKTSLLEFKSVTVTLKQTIYKEEKRIFEATVKLAYIKNGKPTKFPDAFVQLLNI